MSKKSCFRGYFNKQYGKRAQAPFKSGPQHLYHSHWLLAKKLYLKKSLLLPYEILLAHWLNTLATDEKYLVLNRDSLTIAIQMQLSRKEKTFSQVSLHS